MTEFHKPLDADGKAGESLVNGSGRREAATGRNGRGANGHAAPAAKPKRQNVQYNCLNCPGYCCSYPIIVVTKRDVERLAKWFNITPAAAERRFTRSAHGHKRIMRRKPDEHYGKICRFFDQEKRCCGIYKARPAICRSFPGAGRCGYYDFLMFERRTQDDPDYVSLTNHD